MTAKPFVLCATNFSPSAVDAGTVAAKLARHCSEELRLVHVCSDASPSAMAAARQSIESEVQRLNATGARAESRLLTGERPWQVMLDYIKAESPSVVVVASSVKGLIDQWAIGSFSEKIAESSQVPTLVIQNPAVFHAWDWTGERLKVLLALDLFQTSDVVLRWAKSFQAAGPCDFISCHINKPGAGETQVLEDTGELLNTSEVQSRLERELHKKVRDQIGDSTSTVVVQPSSGKPGPAIVEIARSINAHLIAIGTHQRRGFSGLGQYSVSRDLLLMSGMNVICIPVIAQFDPRAAHLPDFHRVLVATDFSELGNAAIPFACAACCIGGRVKIIHVAPPRFHSLRQAGTGWTTDLNQELRGLIPRETAARCQPPEVEVLEGRDVAATICAEAERYGADLVCIASHGLGASRGIHGSVTKAILKMIRRPLLVIRRPEE